MFGRRKLRLAIARLLNALLDGHVVKGRWGDTEFIVGIEKPIQMFGPVDNSWSDVEIGDEE
jgi:hypothetical protein